MSSPSDDGTRGGGATGAAHPRTWVQSMSLRSEAEADDVKPKTSFSCDTVTGAHSETGSHSQAARVLADLAPR